jgi:hypothetical protein
VLNIVYVIDTPPVLIAGGQSIIVTDISISYVSGLGISPMSANIFERDGITKICTVQSAGLFSPSFAYEKANHTFQLTTPFLASRGVKVQLVSGGNATLTITYMNIGA